MSGHSRWWMDTSAPVLMPDQVISGTMIPHVQGYILAMEDVLRDIESMNYDAEMMSVEYVDGHSSALESMRSRANESLLSAQQTLDVLTKKVDDAAE